MEALTRTVSDLCSQFYQRMAEFEQELKRTPDAATGLTADFAAFRQFIIQALSTLQEQMKVMALSIDGIEMRSRHKILLMHGVPESETNAEDTAPVVVKVVKDHLNIDITPADIKRCRRMGRSSHKPRPILFKLKDVALRNRVWLAKTKLKGSGITLSEFLTKSRHKVFMAARDKFGVSQCWTKEGVVFVLDSKGSRHRVTTMEDLGKVESQPSGKQQQSSGPSERVVVVAQPVTASATRTVTSKASKRAAARK
ncbi:uncharacterized protein LOC111359072 [Spodoptera litura]|uniref:Uncharacterized protein LOC111359072 n=1 Tax=Spodoptera litura TaxID=69820 RepID=A0A9J7IYK6_SPOLT|nr:uncharacterized protein LOC111359072 [Spodoptera litura]